MGFRKNVRKRRRETGEIKDLSISESKWEISLREPSSVKNDEFKNIFLMTKKAKQEMSYFEPFDFRIHETELRLFERDHCFTISSEELGLVGYLTFIHPDNLGSMYPIRPDFVGYKKMISELTQAWVSYWQGSMGATRADIEDKPWCILNQIYVKKELRKKNLARQLYTAFSEFCIENDFLRVIDKPNKAFINFSKKLGNLPGRDWVFFHEKLIKPQKILYKGSYPTEEEISSEKPLCQWGVDPMGAILWTPNSKKYYESLGFNNISS
jgi:hypothetical protein